MLDRPIDWRHWCVVGLLLALLLWAGWKLWLGETPQPTATAPPGIQPRMHDAPEAPISVSPGR